MSWNKKEIYIEDNHQVMAQTPVIISASRSTDIPAFYPDWLVNQLQSGYVKWINPFNHKPIYISFEEARVIVFWSKNPYPMIQHLDTISRYIPNYYFQYTLNDYAKEKLEPHVPSLEKRIDTFLELSEKIGKEKVIWRFDPLLLTDTTDIHDLLERIEKIGNQIKNHTRKLVISFADINIYRKVKNNLQRESIRYREFDEESMKTFASHLQQINKNWGLELATCAEQISLEEYHIYHNKCIDDDLMIKLFHTDKKLMDFLQIKGRKDKGQRKLCGCIISKDIGTYNTCPHLCTYCYANSSKESVLKNRLA